MNCFSFTRIFDVELHVQIKLFTKAKKIIRKIGPDSDVMSSSGKNLRNPTENKNWVEFLNHDHTSDEDLEHLIPTFARFLHAYTVLTLN